MLYVDIQALGSTCTKNLIFDLKKKIKKNLSIKQYSHVVKPGATLTQ